MTKVEKKQQLIYEMLNSILKTGFAKLKMDDFVKMVPASRSTVYRYFNSRENIIHDVVKEYLKYIDSFKLSPQAHGEKEWIKNVEQQVEEALVLNSHLSPIFLKDLKAEFPDQYDLLQAKINEHNSELVKFYQAGQEAGFFNEARPELWILQDRLMIPNMVEPAYLVIHGLTVRDAITTYVSMKSRQIIKPEYLNEFDFSFTDKVIEKMNQEIAGR